MISAFLSASPQELAEYCRAHNIRRLSVFGSRLRGDARPDSDLDLLVEFEPGKTPGLGFFSIQEDLSRMFGARVDLNTPACLSPWFRDEVLNEAEVLYGEA